MNWEHDLDLMKKNEPDLKCGENLAERLYKRGIRTRKMLNFFWYSAAIAVAVVIIASIFPPKPEDSISVSPLDFGLIARSSLEYGFLLTAALACSGFIVRRIKFNPGLLISLLGLFAVLIACWTGSGFSGQVLSWQNPKITFLSMVLERSLIYGSLITLVIVISAGLKNRLIPAVRVSGL